MKSGPPKYDHLRYNHHGVLRPNLAFWLILLFLSRNILFLFMIGVSKGRSGQGPVNAAAEFLPDYIFMLSDVPALIVLAAVGARLPKSGAAVRFTWRRGRELLLLSVTVYLGLSIWKHSAAMLAYDPITWVQIGITLLVGGYLLSSRYAKDLFLEFPAPPQEDQATEKSG